MFTVIINLRMVYYVGISTYFLWLGFEDLVKCKYEITFYGCGLITYKRYGF